MVITSKNKIIHKLKIKRNRVDRQYHHFHYSVAVCGAKIGFLSLEKGRRCKRCYKEE